MYRFKEYFAGGEGRLDYQPLFGKGATRHERATEIEPRVKDALREGDFVVTSKIR